MAKKKEDGNYYEKIVTWKKKPNYFLVVIGLILIIIGICLFKPLMIDMNEEGGNMMENHNLNWFQFLAIGIGSMCLTVVSVLGGLVLSVFSLGEGKEVKYRRIGS